MSDMSLRGRGSWVRFWAKVDRSGECWVWLGAADPQGYGRFSLREGAKPRAHRYAYELVVGPIPDGLVLDHLCRNPGCVRPTHLEPVTNQENIRRGRSAHVIRTGRCARGHVLGDDNTVVRHQGWKTCKTCRRITQAAYRQRRRERAMGALV